MGHCLYNVYVPGWILASRSFEVIPPPQSWFFGGQNKKSSGGGIAVSALKFGKTRPKLRLFFRHKILSRRSRLSRTSNDSIRLIRPRPIDCDNRVSEDPVKIFPIIFLPNFWFEHRQKKVFVSDPRSNSHTLPLHPRRSPHIAGQSRPGGHFSRDKRWPQFCKFLGRRACIRNILQLGTYSMRI